LDYFKTSAVCVSVVAGSFDANLVFQYSSAEEMLLFNTPSFWVVVGVVCWMQPSFSCQLHSTIKATAQLLKEAITKQFSQNKFSPAFLEFNRISCRTLMGVVAIGWKRRH
jgi:hypothetical protein